MTGSLMMGLVVFVLLVGFIATIRVGSSRENQQENPQYERNVSQNWKRLLWIYAMGTAGFFALLFFLMR
jgi:hypothetical protein